MTIQSEISECGGISRQRIRRLDRVMPLDLEREFWARGLARVAGLDEAGRGPLAGPVVAAVVIMPAGRAVPGVYDSKGLSADDRAEVFERVWAEAEAVGVGMATPEEIDLINIHKATLLAAERALADMGGAGPQALLTDFLKVTPHGECREVRAMAHGDRLCHAIAAASIVAKVVRDRLMHYLDWEYPGFGLARHKGYGTPEHLAALRERGATGIHRRSFGGVPVFGGSAVRSRFFESSSDMISNAQLSETLRELPDLIEERRGLLPVEELESLSQMVIDKQRVMGWN